MKDWKTLSHVKWDCKYHLVFRRVDVFEKALLKKGLPRKLYVDNGSAYRSKELEHITASLGITLIHARPYKPQGKGKIERFLRDGNLPKVFVCAFH